jgi:hypothetical protein
MSNSPSYHTYYSLSLRVRFIISLMLDGSKIVYCYDTNTTTLHSTDGRRRIRVSQSTLYAMLRHYLLNERYGAKADTYTLKAAVKKLYR